MTDTRATPRRAWDRPWYLHGDWRRHHFVGSGRPVSLL